jgi:hypothetical protein
MPGRRKSPVGSKTSSSRRSKTSPKQSQASTPSASVVQSSNRRLKVGDNLGGGADSSSDDDDSQTKPSTSSPPKELFLTQEETNKLQGTEVTVGTLVGKRLFPHIKFICDPVIELLFDRSPNSICGVILGECSPPKGVTEEKWWANARKWVGKQVAVLRSSKNTQMKWSFMRKLNQIVCDNCCIVNIILTYVYQFGYEKALQIGRPAKTSVKVAKKKITTRFFFPYLYQRSLDQTYSRADSKNLTKLARRKTSVLQATKHLLSYCLKTVTIAGWISTRAMEDYQDSA